MATIPPLKIEIGDGLLLWHLKKHKKKNEALDGGIPQFFMAIPIK